MAERWVLADVGGTHTRIGVAGPLGVQNASLRRFHNSDFVGFEAVLRAYLDEMPPTPVEAICAGVAGPVRSGRAQLTNHDWRIDSETLQKITGAAHVTLLNDLQAQGYALDDLNADHLTPLAPGAETPPGAARLVMGLGTGCNVAVVHATPQGLFVPPAESGHASLPYVSGPLADLVDHLGQAHPHRPIESALSGPGLGNIYAWLTDQMKPAVDILAAHRADEAEARQALQYFCQLLGQVAGDLALAHLPMGGLFFIGGMARAVAPILQETGFHTGFTAKGPYAPILRDIPIWLIEDDTAALHGCARYLRQRLA